MKRKLSRLIKKTLVTLGWDDFVADQYHKTHWYFFKKLIPDRTFYKREEEKKLSGTIPGLKYSLRILRSGHFSATMPIRMLMPH